MCNYQAAKYSSNIGPSEQIKLIVYWKEVYLFCLWPVLHVLIYINPCTLRTSNCWTVLTFLRALVLLALKDLYFILIAIQLFMAFGGETVGQQIDKLSKYWWHLEFFLRQRCIRYHLINLRLIMQFLGFYFSLWIHSCVTDYYKQEILLLLLQDNKTKCVHFNVIKKLKIQRKRFINYSFQATSGWKSCDNQSHCAMENWGFSVFCGGSQVPYETHHSVKSP